MTEELKPCPFCGFAGAAHSEDGLPGMFRVYCEDCGASGPHAGAKDFAEEEWNRRT